MKPVVNMMKIFAYEYYEENRCQYEALDIFMMTLRGGVVEITGWIDHR